MAAPAFVAAGAIATGSTSLSIDYYTGVAANHIAIVWVGAESTPTIGDITDFTGLTQVDSTDSGGRLFWKRLTGGESGSVSCATTGGLNARGVMIGVSGAITSGTPYEGANTNTGNSATATSATIVTTVAETFGIRCGYGAGSTAATDPPATWDERAESGTTFSFTVDTKEIASAGTEAASDRTVGSGTWVVQTLAILPPAGGQPYYYREGGVPFCANSNNGVGHTVWRKSLGWRKTLSGLLMPPKPRILRPAFQ